MYRSLLVNAEADAHSRATRHQRLKLKREALRKLRASLSSKENLVFREKTREPTNGTGNPNSFDKESGKHDL